MANNGWIKLHRKIVEKGWFRHSEYVHLWVCLLLKANHSGNEFFSKGKTVVLKPGQFVTGRAALSQETGIPESNIERILSTFEHEHQIGQQKTNQGRLITILSWDKYQEFGQQIGQQMDIGWTTNGQPMDTNKNVKNDKKVKKNTNTGGDKSPKKNIEVRDAEFKEQVFSFTQYDNEKLNDFYNHFSEYTLSRTKMLFELEETWELPKRLAKWRSFHKNTTSRPLTLEEKMRIVNQKNRTQ